LLDVSVAPIEPMRPGGDVPAAIRLGPGGQGANLAVRLARLGVATRLACGLADDAVGRLLRQALEDDGVEVLAAAVPSTGAVAVLIDRGERTMLSQRAPFADLVDVASLVAGASWLAISGYVLLEEGALDLARRCAALDVRRAVLGCDVPAERITDWRAAVSAARPDILFLNADEAHALAGVTDVDALVVVTERGGVRATGPGVAVQLEGAPDAGAAVDTTGAGDAFAAAVLAHIGARWPVDGAALRAALAAGIAAARRVVGVAGAQGAVEGERVAAR
jgi:sugar/nucleoside kinase (ribokinase family)